METEEKMMTGEESLKIITEMINKTKVSVRQGSFHLLFWGWLLFFCSLSSYLLLNFTNVSNPWLVWILTIPGVFVSMIYGFITGRRERIHTYAGRLYMWTWIGFLAAAIVLFTIMWGRLENVGPFILLLAGLPTFISGYIIKFRPLIIGGIIFWICSLIACFGGHAIAPLATPVAMLAGYLIPGYLLKRRVDNEEI